MIKRLEVEYFTFQPEVPWFESLGQSKGIIKEALRNSSYYLGLFINWYNLSQTNLTHPHLFSALTIFFPKCYLFHSQMLFLQFKLEGLVQWEVEINHYHPPASLKLSVLSISIRTLGVYMYYYVIFKTEEPCNTPASSIEGCIIHWPWG